MDLAFPRGVPLHVVRRTRGRAPCFSGEADRRELLERLRGAAARSACAVHAYVLMGNHVHLLVTLPSACGVEQLMHAVGERGARPILDADAAWEDGFEVQPLYERRYLLACMRYIELNPVRAGIVRRPGDFRWSSYRANALGRDDPLVTPHALYCALERSPQARQAAYRAQFLSAPRGRRRAVTRSLRARRAPAHSPGADRA
jgi:putative transposase